MELQTKEQASRSSRLSGIVGRVYFCSCFPPSSPPPQLPLGYAKISAIIVMQTGRWIMQRAKFIRAALAHFCPPTSSYQIILWPVLIINKPRSGLCALRCNERSLSTWPLRLFLPFVGRSTSSSSLPDRVVVEIYELKWGCFFFSSGMRRFLLSRAQLRCLFFFFFRRKVYRGEIMSRDERERDLMVA